MGWACERAGVCGRVGERAGVREHAGVWGMRVCKDVWGGVRACEDVRACGGVRFEGACGRVGACGNVRASGGVRFEGACGVWGGGRAGVWRRAIVWGPACVWERADVWGYVRACGGTCARVVVRAV